jgi:hypothetical protein
LHGLIKFWQPVAACAVKDDILSLVLVISLLRTLFFPVYLSFYSTFLPTISLLTCLRTCLSYVTGQIVSRDETFYQQLWPVAFQASSNFWEGCTFFY